MSWVFLIFGIVLEVIGTVCMKLSDGFTKPTPSVLMFVFWGAGFGLLSLAIRRIDISIAYAMWSGLGVAIITLIGIVWFGEYASPGKLVSIGLIVGGVIGLQFSSDTHAPEDASAVESDDVPETRPDVAHPD